ncbi:hypothetical protein TNCV_139031 [Trichonephila clavipes]|nr:hypothetical protein TNCV_139031 [Trichonephila clavipes]
MIRAEGRVRRERWPSRDPPTRCPQERRVGHSPALSCRLSSTIPELSLEPEGLNRIVDTVLYVLNPSGHGLDSWPATHEIESNEDPCVERLTHIKSVNAQNLPLSSSGSSEWDLPAYV